MRCSLIALLTTFHATLAFAARAKASTTANHGDATWYTPGLGSCGKYDTESEHVVALSMQENAHERRCWQYITISYQGKSVRAQVVDSCPGCSQYSLDLSPSAFKALAPLGAGRIHVTWTYS